MGTNMADRLQCSMCNGTAKTTCAVCNGTKTSHYIGADFCELCDENGQQTCQACGGVRWERVVSADELRTWYASGQRDFARAKFNGGLLSYKILNFRGVNLSHTDLSRIQFTDADFLGAKLEFTDFSGAHLKNCNFEKANLSWAKIKQADLEGSSFVRANLRSADLTDTSLRNAPLERADLRDVKGLRLDSNYIRGARFSAGANDLWSTLRRKYTGPMFVFHFFVLVCFLIPYGARTGYWVLVHDAQGTTLTAARHIADELGGATKLPSSESLTGDLVVVQTIRDFRPCFSSNCHAVPIWQLLVGLDRSYLNALLPVTLILYNLCRAVLTWRVTLLREEEERSGFAPALASYRWLSSVHRAYSLLFFAAMGVLLWHVVAWLTLTVMVQS